MHVFLHDVVSMDFERLVTALAPAYPRDTYTVAFLLRLGLSVHFR